MAFCEDPSLTYLNRLGYNVVRLPRTGLNPLDVLGREGRHPPEHLGALPTVWKSAAKQPPVEDGVTAEIAGKTTSNIRIDFGLKILEGVLGAMGAAVPQVGLAYSRARTIRFEFKEATVRKINLLMLGNYLSSGDLNSQSPIVRHYMLNEEAQAFVISDVLLSASLRVTALDEKESDAKVDVSAIQGAVSTSIDVKAMAGTEGDLVYHGKMPLAFGYKAHEIVVNGKSWDVRRLDPSSDTALFGTGTKELAPPVLFGGRQFLGRAARWGE